MKKSTRLLATGFNVVLVTPEIPQNTGNIARLCACTGSNLHLIKPMGFSLEDRYLRRAGLDYWDRVNVKVYDSFESLKRRYPQGRFILTSTHAPRNLFQFRFQPHDFFVFGKESSGLPRHWIDSNPQLAISIPILPETRSLNLANSVAIVLFEAIRQLQLYTVP